MKGVKMNRKFTYNRTLYQGQGLKLWAGKILKKLPPETDTLVCMSSSGMSLASAVATLSDKELQIKYVRKVGEKSHGGDTTSLERTAKYVVFIDDFISTGATFEACLDEIYFDIGLIIICYPYDGREANQKLSNKFNLPIRFADGTRTVKPK